MRRSQGGTRMIGFPKGEEKLAGLGSWVIEVPDPSRATAVLKEGSDSSKEGR